MPSSCLYIGHVLHRRLRPRVHRLRYRVFWMLLDLDEIDRLSDRLRLFSRKRFNLTSFFDCDHGDGSDVPLRRQIENLLRLAECQSTKLTIYLLCMPRILGYGFNPLCVYFCYRADGSLEAIIYEVHNTFGERHSYVIPSYGTTSEIVEQRCDKKFFVSPFLGMDMSYAFRIFLPEKRVSIAIQAKQENQAIIATSLSGTRTELADSALLNTFLMHPLLTLKVIAGIHWHALRLLIKGFRMHARPPAESRSIKATSSRGMSS